MKRIIVKELLRHVEKQVTVQGWLHKKRLLGAITFLQLRDRSGLVQIVVEDKEEIEKLRGLYSGTVLTISATVKSDERAPGSIELYNPTLEIVVPVTQDSPIEIDKDIGHKSENLDMLFEHRAVSLRNIRESAVFKIQAKVLESSRGYFKLNDFVEINTPKLLAEATEGGAEVFKLDYFGKTATLAQSAQFYKQMMVGVYERVFETNPVYRAELSATTRHMSEYISIDVEMGFIDFSELKEFAHGLLKRVINDVWSDCGPELELWGASKPLLSDSAVSIPLQEVHNLYENSTGEVIENKLDLTPAEERWICAYAKDNLGTEAVFVTEWPSSDMKFYHKKMESNSELAERSDFLFRGVEIMTCPMREHRYDVLVQQLKDKLGADPDASGFKHYLQAFRHGLPPHGGFGLGLERLTQKIIGLQNVKEAALFPRDINRLAP
jgi:nondiscriminating aspartyl-tRNA synthetase